MTENNKIVGGLFAFLVAPFATAIYALTRAGEKWSIWEINFMAQT
jgi:hypothetical protein